MNIDVTLTFDQMQLTRLALSWMIKQSKYELDNATDPVEKRMAEAVIEDYTSIERLLYEKQKEAMKIQKG